MADKTKLNQADKQDSNVELAKAGVRIYFDPVDELHLRKQARDKGYLNMQRYVQDLAKQDRIIHEHERRKR